MWKRLKNLKFSELVYLNKFLKRNFHIAAHQVKAAAAISAAAAVPADQWHSCNPPTSISEPLDAEAERLRQLKAQNYDMVEDGDWMVGVKVCTEGEMKKEVISTAC